MSTTILHEPVVLRFRGHERALPLASLAISLRRSPERTASMLDFLIQGPPEGRSAPTTEDPGSPSPDSVEGGMGGGDRSERTATLSIGTSENILQQRSERSGAHRSERDRSERRAREGDDDLDDATFARMIAVDLGDMENVAAIRKLVGTYPRQLLDQALVRTLAVPADRIRSSRGAIFTGIVRKLAAEARSPTP